MKLKMLLQKQLGRHISVKVYANINDISLYMARKHMTTEMDNGIIEKYNNRFYYISANRSLNPKDIQKKLISKAKINLEVARLINENLIYDKKWMVFIDTTPTQVIMYFPLCKKKITLNLSEPVENIEHRIILRRNNIKVI